MTRQGLRDLNHYGPKRQPETPLAPKAVEEPVAVTVPPPPPATETVAPAPPKE